VGRLNLVLALFVSSVVSLVPTPGFAQASSLTGTVFTAGGDRRVVGATVELCDAQGNSLRSTSANDAGEFSFSGLALQRYILRVQADGFAVSEVPVDLSFGSQHGISISLKGLPQGSAVPDRATISAHELSMPENARELVESGKIKLYTENKAEAALIDFRSATIKAPSYYEAYYHAGMAYLTMQKEAEAEKQFRKSVELSQSKYGDADIALGTILLRRQEEREGESFLRQGLALNPQSWPGQVELGKLELSRGHLEPALAAAEKAESIAPHQSMVYRLLALVHMKAKNYPALMSDLDNYIRLDPNSPAGVRAKELRAEVERQLPQAATSAAGNK
jgi:tetratricopeptide (TPR) repeat protein